MARYLVTFLPGSPVPTRTKYIDDASGPPDENVDAGTDGVAFGSVLWDGVDLWFCTDPTTAAAQWVQISGGGTETASLIIDDITGATDVDRALAATHDLTLVGDATLTPIHSDPTAGDAIDLRILIRQDGTGGRTLAWGGTIAWTGGAEPTMPSAADALLTVGLLSVDDGATWLGYAATNDALDAHLADTTDAHDGSAISITDTGGYYTSATVEGALQEIGAGGIGGSGLGPLLIADIHSTPIIFADLLLTEDEDDFLYGDAP